MDPGGSYSRHSVVSRIAQPVAIVAVNTQLYPPQATGIMRSREYVQIDISHHVGAVQVTPAVGQQWIIIRDRGVWKLDSQLPINTPDQLVPMVEGQTRIGSSGPTNLHGSEVNIGSPVNISAPVNIDAPVNISAPLRTLTPKTADRPDAESVPVGSQIYDSTLNQPLWSDGTKWRDAARPLVFETADRPDAESFSIGSQIYDSTLNQPLWSDGTNWRDAAGSLT
jgi:hypothetical protein